MLAAQNLWRIRARADFFKGIKKELYQMEEEIKAINNVAKARKVLERARVLRTDSFFLAWDSNEKAVLDVVTELIQKMKMIEEGKKA